MSLDIEDPEADRLARDLAAITGESLTDAVKRSLAERLQRERRRSGRTEAMSQPDRGERLEGQALIDRLNEISRHCAAAPDYDTRSPDEIIGYDANGLPT